MGEPEPKCKGCTLEDFDQRWKILIRNKDFQVNYALNPEVDGHLVIQPRRHVEGISKLCPQEAKDLGLLIRNFCLALQEALNPDKIYVYSFNETPGYHLHFHLKPKSSNVPKDKKGAEFVKWSDEKLKWDQASIEKIMGQIKTAYDRISKSR